MGSNLIPRKDQFIQKEKDVRVIDAGYELKISGIMIKTGSD